MTNQTIDIGPLRPLDARSVVLSTLLGTDPPRMPVARLVRAGEIFGLRPGTVRTALTRMVRPHVAIVTNVLPVHVGNFENGEVAS